MSMPGSVLASGEDRVVFLNLMNPLGNEFLQWPLQYLLPILRYPHDVKLMMVRSMSAVSYFHTVILPQHPTARFHPRADARGPQRNSDRSGKDESVF